MGIRAVPPPTYICIQIKIHNLFLFMLKYKGISLKEANLSVIFFK